MIIWVAAQVMTSYSGFHFVPKKYGRIVRRAWMSKRSYHFSKISANTVEGQNMLFEAVTSIL